ncbi:MAG: potassium transporter TrkG [Gammaproteobacteria bacterium]
MADSASTLVYAVRLGVVGRYLSQLALMLALLSLVPFGVSLGYGEYAFSQRYAIVVVSLLVVVVPGLRLPAPGKIQTNEAIAVVCLAFVLAPAIIAFPMAADGLRWEDALFESVSAITTTGLSTAGTVEGRSPVFLFARAWMQWSGGLGIAVLSVALLMGHHTAARRLAEPTEPENIATTARTQARQVLLIYAALTVVGSLLLWGAGGEAFGAVVHMLSALSTGGFSTFDASIAAMPRAGAWLVTGFAFCGAVPLLLYFHALRGRPLELLGDAEVRALLVAVALVTGLLALSLHAHAGMPWGAALEHGALLGASAQTTTGFASLSVGQLDPTSKGLLVCSMLIGGASGSTAGGIKLLRLLVILRLLQYFLRRTAMPPHAVAEPRLGGHLLEAADVERVALVVLLFGGLTALSWLVFLAYGYAPLDALFEVVSAVGTVGLSTGISAPGLEVPLKLLLCVDMLAGRLEILALLVLVYPRTWIGKRA